MLSYLESVWDNTTEDLWTPKRVKEYFNVANRQIAGKKFTANTERKN